MKANVMKISPKNYPSVAKSIAMNQIAKALQAQKNGVANF